MFHTCALALLSSLSRLEVFRGLFLRLLYLPNKNRASLYGGSDFPKGRKRDILKLPIGFPFFLSLFVVTVFLSHANLSLLYRS